MVLTNLLVNLLLTNRLTSLVQVKSRKTLIFPSPAPSSLYLYGGTGCGKTYLMDLFYDTLPIKGIHLLTISPLAHSLSYLLTYSVNTGKRRIHFHNFMIDIHKRLHAYRMRNNAAGGEKKIKGLYCTHSLTHSLSYSLTYLLTN